MAEVKIVGGICAFCRNLVGSELGLNDEIHTVYRCDKGKYDKGNVECYFSQKQFSKTSRAIDEIQSKCDIYVSDDRLKTKTQS